MEYTSLDLAGRTPEGSKRPEWSGVVAGAVMPQVVYFWGVGGVAPALVLSVFVFFFLAMAAGGELRDSLTDTAFRILGVVYIAVPLSYVVLLRGVERGEWWLLFALVVVWANDTMAYTTGRLIGRNKLAPSVSPKKTIEGLIGGLLGGVVAAFVFNHFAGLGMTPVVTVLVSLAGGAVAVVGDLAESVVKRSAGVKDSGQIIPGHGGIMDRIDSVLFTIPPLYYFLLWQ